MINIDFKEEKDGAYKSVSTYSKKARGQFLNYLIKNQIPAYFTAVGTQSSAATIPVNIQCGLKNGTI